jgi:hypothetical protein
MNFASILSATHASISADNSHDDAARAAFPVLIKAGATLAELLREERAGQRVATAVSAAHRTLVAGMRALLKQDGVDVLDPKAVRDAIRAAVWLDEGHAEPVAKADDETTYMRVAKRISRLATAIVDAQRIAPEKTKVRVPKDAQATIDALFAQHGAAIIREALKRAAAAK